MKILAFINLDEWNSLEGQPAIELPLVRRVIDVAKATKSDVHFSHLVHDSALGTGSADDTEVIKLREQLQTIERRWLDDLVTKTDSSEFNVTAKTQFMPVTANALVHEIETHKPDLVFKRSRDHNFVLGLFSNLDWELIRRSPVPVWFVKSETKPIGRVVAAVDLEGDGESSNISLDGKVLHQASYMREALQAELKVVHAYPGAQLPLMALSYAGTDPALAMSPGTATVLSESQRKQDEQTKRHHKSAVQRLCEGYKLETDDIMLEKGQPTEVITRVCEQLGAGLIVMGATNIGRWDRLFSEVHAEPTLADAKADVLFVPE